MAQVNVVSGFIRIFLIFKTFKSQMPMYVSCLFILNIWINLSAYVFSLHANVKPWVAVDLNQVLRYLITLGIGGALFLITFFSHVC